MNIEQLYNRFHFFSQIPESVLDEMVTMGNRVEINRNFMIVDEGRTCSEMGFVLSGEKKIYKQSPCGREVTLYDVGPGETCLLNTSCILSDSPFPANSKALTDMELFVLPANQFRQLFNKHKEIRNFAIELINSNIVMMMELISEIAFGRMDERLIDYIITKSENGKLFVTHEQIANSLGTAREVVSRLLKHYERQGVLSLSRKCIELLRSPLG